MGELTDRMFEMAPPGTLIPVPEREPHLTNAATAAIRECAAVMRAANERMQHTIALIETTELRVPPRLVVTDSDLANEALTLLERVARRLSSNDYLFGTFIRALAPELESISPALRAHIEAAARRTG